MCSACKCACMTARANAHMYARSHTHTLAHAHEHTHTHTRTHTCRHARVHTQTHATCAHTCSRTHSTVLAIARYHTQIHHSLAHTYAQVRTHAHNTLLTTLMCMQIRTPFMHTCMQVSGLLLQLKGVSNFLRKLALDKAKFKLTFFLNVSFNLLFRENTSRLVAQC